MKTKHKPTKTKIRKEISDVTDFIMAFIRRNNDEQDIPPGYKSIKELMKILKCNKRALSRIIEGLKKTNSIEYIKLKRVDDKIIKSLSYYKIDDKLLKAALKNK